MRAGKSPPRVSAIAFYKHRFKRALQSFASSGGDPVEAYAKLKRQLVSSNLKFAKTAGLFVFAAAAFIASVESGSLNVNTSLVSFSVPSIYLLFLLSLIWVSFCFSLITVFQMIAFSNAFKGYLGRFETDYEMLVFLRDVEIDDYLAPPGFDRFLEPSRCAFRLRVLIFCIIILAGLLPVVAAQYAVVSHSLSVILIQQSLPLHKSLAIASVALIVGATLYSVSAFIPFKSKKQTGLIRFIFLYKLHGRGSHQPHPQSDLWLSETTDNV